MSSWCRASVRGAYGVLGAGRCSVEWQTAGNSVAHALSILLYLASHGRLKLRRITACLESIESSRAWLHQCGIENHPCSMLVQVRSRAKHASEEVARRDRVAAA
jgi:hypothetical protein